MGGKGSSVYDRRDRLGGSCFSQTNPRLYRIQERCCVKVVDGLSTAEESLVGVDKFLKTFLYYTKNVLRGI